MGARVRRHWQYPDADRYRPQQASGRLVFEHGRDRLSLDGTWRICADPMRIGTRRRYWRERVQQRGGPPVEYDYEAWTPIRVPGDWNTQLPELARYDGCAWCVRRFDFRPRRGERLFLRFGAVNYLAGVWLNGESLGGHEGGFTPFEFEVTGKVRRRNTLVVMADSTMCDDGAPTSYYDWFNYGGITRSVELLRVPRTFIRDMRVRLVERGGASLVRVEVEIDGAGQPRSVRFKVPGLGISGTVKLAKGEGSGEFRADPVRWSPETPRLYGVSLAIPGDRVTDTVGFRTVARRGHRILLNGKPVYLRGICAHEERPVNGGGRTLSRREVTALLEEAKSLGCNFVRLAHYPHTEEMARQADRLGLMLWEEIPVYWGIHFWKRSTLDNCRQQLREMIRRDGNRASVIMWSVGNETPDIAERDRFFAALARQARRLDPSRLTAGAFVRQELPGKRVFGFAGRVARHLDVVGINEYFGWYEQNDKGEMAAAKWNLAAVGRPVIFSEFGAEAVAGRHGRVGERWTEEDQADVYRRQIAMIEKLDLCAGLSPWLLVDFRSSHRVNRHQRGYNRKGVVGVGLKRKLAFGVLRQFYIRKQLESFGAATRRTAPAPAARPRP